MLTINASSLRATAQDNAATSAGGADTSADPAGFSSLLRQTQAAAAPNASTPPVPASTPMQKPMPAATRHDDTTARAADRSPAPAAEHDGDAACEAPRGNDRADTEATDATDRTRAQLKARIHAAGPKVIDPAPVETTDHDIKATDEAASDPSAAAATPAALPDAAATPTDVPPWLAAALQRPTGPSKADDSTASPRSDATVAIDAPRATPRPTPRDSVTLDADPTDRAARGAAPSIGAAEAPGLRADRAEPHATRGQPTAAATDIVSTAATTHAAPTVATPTALPAWRTDAAPTNVAVATPLTAPDFAQAMGLQLSVLAKDGVQQAELHLNPAEMGPVSVQIVMDGTQARIDFGADMAATRHAIESGLPELASALRDAGFTLAGGGVSQHSGSRQQGGRSGTSDDTARRNARQVGVDSVARVSAAAQRAVTRGGLDLYA